MIYSAHLMNMVHQVDLLLRFLPRCPTEAGKDKILHEVRILRQKITAIEEMTNTEKCRNVKVMTVSIEADFEENLSAKITN